MKSRIKEAAYSIYTDIKNKTKFLVSENLKHIQNLDISIDLQSIYFLLPEYQQFAKYSFGRNSSKMFDWFFHSSSSQICLDFGRLTFQGGETHLSKDENDVFHDAKVCQIISFRLTKNSSTF